MNDCGYRYYLERVEKVWRKPAAWFPQGSAVHKVIEEYEKSGRLLNRDDTVRIFSESYSEEVGKYTSATPNLDWWTWSGPYNGEKDLERRYRIGLDQSFGYIDFAESHPTETPWVTPDGTPAIELGFEIALDGVPVRGFIDIVYETPGGSLRPRDAKTGKKVPDDPMQLATYAVAIEATYGRRPWQGDYYMAASRTATVPIDLREYPTDRVTDAYGRLDALILAEEFDPQPEKSKCRFCSVSASCEFKAG